jgi:hypothetical protein
MGLFAKISEVWRRSKEAGFGDLLATDPEVVVASASLNPAACEAGLSPQGNGSITRATDAPSRNRVRGDPMVRRPKVISSYVRHYARRRDSTTRPLPGQLG